MSSYTYLEKCEAILAWAEAEKPDFNTNFTLDMKHDLQFFGESGMTHYQLNAIDNIVQKFKIDVGGYING